MVSLNAGGLRAAGGYGRVPVVRDLARANSLLYRQSTSLRTRLLVERFQHGRNTPDNTPLPEGARNGILVALGTNFPDPSGKLREWRQAFDEARTWKGQDLAFVATSFDQFPQPLSRRLVHRGWWLAGAALASYYPNLLPNPAALSPPPLDE